MTKGARAGGTLESGDGSTETLRLFLALVLPDETVQELMRWTSAELLAGLLAGASERGVRAIESPHVTLAFLGSRPRSDVPAIVKALREASAATAAFELVPRRYRETRSVGMVVLDDPSGETARLADRLHGRLEELGVYEREARRWLPHATVVRFSTRQADRGADRRRKRRRLEPGVSPEPPEIAAFAPSEAAAFLSRLHPSGARYEILERCQLQGQLR